MGVGDLDLERGPVEVDIGYLTGTDHREAFAAIFETVLRANQGLLGGLSMSPRRLYDSGRKKVTIELPDRPSCRLEVRFDNPRFELLSDGVTERPSRFLRFWE